MKRFILFGIMVASLFISVNLLAQSYSPVNRTGLATPKQGDELTLAVINNGSTDKSQLVISEKYPVQAREIDPADASVSNPANASVVEDTLYEDVPDMPDADLKAVLGWIKSRVEIVRTPFCYRDSYGRGAGVVRSVCASGLQKDGALCYPQCNTGYTGAGPVCWQNCPSGFRDDGAFCAKPASYGRGAGRVPDVSCPAGYTQRGVGSGSWCDNGPTWPWDLKTCAATMTCHSDEEMNGGLCYPKCKSGFYAVGCCTCSPSCPADFGTDIGVSCTKKSYGRGAGSVLLCPSGTIADETGGPAGLCYPSCKSGYHGVGPVCWQNCTNGLSDCGAGCAASTIDCGTTTFDMVFSVAVLAANIATMGMASEGATVAKAGEEIVSIGNKTKIVKSGSVAKYLCKAIDLIQSTSQTGLATDATLIKRFINVKTGTKLATAITAGKVVMTAYSSFNQFASMFTGDFENQTSPAINQEISTRFIPTTANFIKKAWAEIQFNEVATANGFAIAKTVMDVVSIIDITGVVSVINAYTHPVCGASVPFPTLSQTYR